jgi:6-pyruvoyltetrahydropterin 2'-reductase
MSEKKYYYSEIFNSIQGEGTYTGVHTLWLRYFLCNLQCDGFGQIDPTNPETYELPYADFDAMSVNRVEDLPVWSKGCDSSYTWSKKFKHLMGHATPEVIAEKIIACNKNLHNTSGLFLHPVSGQSTHMCFTGGEPLMPHAQQCSMDILKYFINSRNIPGSVTFETNGTQKLTNEFRDWVQNKSPVEIFFSVSPKLWTVAGEKREKAIKPEVVAEYSLASHSGHLKFVLGSEKRQWDELEEVVKMFRDVGVNYPVYIMPVGAREEEQTATAGDVAKMAFDRGYNVSGRMHVYLFGNAIGT